MMFYILLAALMFASAASVDNPGTCDISAGFRMNIMNKLRTLPVNVPCKYDAIKQKCGPYKLTVTPGQRFLYPNYILNSAYIAVKDIDNTDIMLWKGYTNNKKAGMNIIKGSEAFTKLDGIYETEDLFTVTNSTHDVTLTEKNGIFSLTFSAYDFTGNGNLDSKLSFKCNTDDPGTPYPEQLCGDRDGGALVDRAKLLFKKNKLSMKELSKTFLFDIFNDKSVFQTEGNCQRASSIMQNKCQTDEDKVLAINACHRILDSKPHTTCIFRHTCSPMDTFVECMEFACSGFSNKTACGEIANDIDLCRNFNILTENVKSNCRADLLTAEDNPYFGKSER